MELNWGIDVVKHLLPHRAPALLVDHIERYAGVPKPTLTAHRWVSGEDKMFDGHFPDRAIFPGFAIIEGLAQTSGLLRALRRLDAADKLQDAMADPETVAGSTRIGLLADVRVKISRPVLPNSSLEYVVSLNRELDGLAHLEVEALCSDSSVARGSLVLADAPLDGFRYRPAGTDQS